MTASEAAALAAPGSGEHGGHDAEALRSLGFWLYLMSDLVIFSALFATYVVMAENFAGGPTAKELFHLPGVLAETLLLLTSSAVYGLAMIALHKGDAKGVRLGLVVTFLLGLGFLVMELREFAQMIADGATPQRSGFLSAFFTLVGTHGAHVAMGLLWMLVMLAQVAAKGLTGPVAGRLLRLGMFWHFLDIVWIGVFTVVYLLGVV